MSYAINAISFMTPWNKPADDWARAKAEEMHKDGYPPGVIVAKLEVYGIGFYAARSLLRNPDQGDAT
jgi:hypothetical protein